MKNKPEKFEINFYHLQSSFKNIAQSLCKKLTDKKVLINLSDEQEMIDLDKFLWTKDKNSFIPHKTFKDKIHLKDKLILFYGDYIKMNRFVNFDILLVSPEVKIRKIMFFKKFFFFSYESAHVNFYSRITENLRKKIELVKCFHEYETFKWKLIPNP